MFWKEDKFGVSTEISDQDIERYFHTKFRNIHLTIELCLIFVMMLAGIFLFFFMEGDTSIIQVDPQTYIRDFLIIPLLVNATIYTATYVLIKDRFVSRYISEKNKNIIMNLSFLLLVFASTTFYQFFPSTYISFILPVILSAVYGRYKIITIISALSVVLSMLGAFFIQYDKDKIVTSYYLVNIIIAEVLLFVCIIYAFLTTNYVKSRYVAMKKNVHIIDKLRTKLNTDNVTGLYSILEFKGYLRRIRGDEGGQVFSVVYLAIDEFMTINSNFGYAYGDRVLNLFAETVKADDSIFAMRYGGAEFVLIIPVPVYEALNIVDKIRLDFVKKCKEVLNNPYISFSAGIIVGDAYLQPEVMLAQANSAMNYAREHDKNGICVFDEGSMEIGETRSNNP